MTGRHSYAARRDRGRERWWGNRHAKSERVFILISSADESRVPILHEAKVEMAWHRSTCVARLEQLAVRPRPPNKVSPDRAECPLHDLAVLSRSRYSVQTALDKRRAEPFALQNR